MSASAPLPAEPAPKSVSAAIQPFVDRQELAGAVLLVADKNRVLTAEAVGWADVAAKKPMTTDALFWVASQSKPIAATAIMILVDEGKVHVDDPVEMYLPEFRGQMFIAEEDTDHVLLKKPSHPVTVKNLLTHTSGLPYRIPMEDGPLDRLPLAARVRGYGMSRLQFDPGTSTLYSNAAVNTAARIVEVVSGMPYEQFLDERLFKPLGMNDTTFFPSDEQAKRLAKAYQRGPGGAGLVEVPIPVLSYPLTDRANRFPVPGSGLLSTAHDLARFYQMMLNGGQLDGRRTLSEYAVNEMTRPQTPAGLPQSTGFGFDVGEKFFGHGGTYFTNTSALTDSGLILVWLVQHASFPGAGAKAQDAFKQTALKTYSLAAPAAPVPARSGPIPTYADVSYGPYPHQILDVYMPPQTVGACPVLVWYGGIWEPSKRPLDLHGFFAAHVAVVAVETRTLTDGMNEKARPPISYVMTDACRAVQFVRLNAAKWNLSPQRIAVAGSSQGTLPALYVACAGDRADPQSTDPVDRESTKVTCVGAHRSQPSIDPKRMQEWVPGVEWGAPALGCGFEESLKRREELLPVISRWSPDALLHPGTPPIYFENNWGLTQPEDVKEMDYKVHSPGWGLGFRKLAQAVGVTCYVKYPGQPTEKYQDVWDFIIQQLTATAP